MRVVDGVEVEAGAEEGVPPRPVADLGLQRDQLAAQGLVPACCKISLPVYSVTALSSDNIDTLTGSIGWSQLSQTIQGGPSASGNKYVDINF